MKYVTIKLYKDNITQIAEYIQVEVGTKLSEVVSKNNVKRSVILVNGKIRTTKYKVKENDNVAIRVYPNGATGAGVAIILGFAAVVGAITGFAAWYNGKQEEEASKLPEDIGDLVESASIVGSNNQSTLNKPVPLVLGKRSLTPYICGKGYTLTSGTYGENQTFICAYMLGYKPLKVSDIRLKYIDAATNKNNVKNGKISKDGTFFKNHNLEFEIRDTGELELYSQKVVEEKSDVELINYNGMNKFDTGVFRYSAHFPSKLEIEIKFNGLYKINYDKKNNSSRVNTKIDLICQYSFTNTENSWKSIPINSNASKREYHDDVIRYVYNGDAYTPTQQNNKVNEILRKFESEGKHVISSGHSNTYDAPYKYTLSVRIQYYVNVPCASYNSNTGVSTIELNENRVMRFLATKTFTYDEIKSMLNDDNPTQSFVYVRIARCTESRTTDDYCDKAYFSAIRTWCFDPKKTKEQKKIVPQSIVDENLRDKTVRLAMKIDANDTLRLKDSIDSINCTVQSEAKVFRNGALSEDVIPTSNPAALALSLFTHSSLSTWKYDIDKQVDMIKFSEFYDFCEKSKYEFNQIYTSQTKFGDIIAKVVEAGHAFPIVDSNKYSLFIDKSNSVPTLLLNNHNLLSDGLTNSKEFNEHVDGLIVKYYDKNYDYKESTVEVMFDKDKLDDPNRKMESVEYPYITDGKEAFRRGKYDLAKKRLRNETWVRKVSVEGELLSVGDIAEIQDDTLLVGIGDGGRIKSIVLEDNLVSSFTVDSIIDLSDSTKTYGVKIIHFDENNVKSVTTYKLKKPKRYSSEFELLEPNSNIDVDDLVAFGEFDKITSKVLVLSKKHNEDNTFDLTLSPYDEGIYIFDDPEKMYDDIPEFSPNITKPYGVICDELPNDYINKGDLIDATDDIFKVLNSSDDLSLYPNDISIAVNATQEGLNLQLITSTYGLQNSCMYVMWFIDKGNSETIEYKSTSLSDIWNFKNNDVLYPEINDLINWKVKAYLVNSYGKQSELSKEIFIDLTNYGTWLLSEQKPSVLTRVSDRTISLMISLPQRSDNKQVYGTIKYKVQVKKNGIADENYYRPATSSDPYASEDNYKDGEGFVVSDEVYIQTMPLTGQETNKIIDTSYSFKVIAFNEKGDSAETIINATATCTSIRDIVKANETTKSSYVSALSAISANIGVVTEGTFGDYDKNHIAMSTFKDDNNQQWYKGDVRLGGETQYFKISPVKDEDGNVILDETGNPRDYSIEIKAGAIELTSGDSALGNGTVFYDEGSGKKRRLRLNANGIYIEVTDSDNPESASVSEWNVVGQISLDSNKNLILTNNSSIIPEKGIRVTNVTAYHFKNGVTDENGDDSLRLNLDESSINIDKQYILNENGVDSSYNGLIDKQFDSSQIVFITKADKIEVGNKSVDLSTNEISDNLIATIANSSSGLSDEQISSVFKRV